MASDFLLSVFAVIVLLGVLIFVHEMGHFPDGQVFQRRGSQVLPGIWKDTVRQKGGARPNTSISMIPLGG